MSSRSRHSLLGKRVQKPKDGTNKDVLEMTKLFLDHERANRSKDRLKEDDIPRSTAASKASAPPAPTRAVLACAAPPSHPAPPPPL